MADEAARSTTSTHDVTPEDRELGNRSGRPAHLRFRYGSLVFVGGTLGTLTRYSLGTLLPAPGAWPLPTLIINLSGALLLGVILEALLRRGTDTGKRRVIRLFVGTGFLGAFTTYSTLSLEAVTLGTTGDAAGSLLYVAVSLIGGVLASFGGIWAASTHHRARSRRRRSADLRKEPWAS